MNKKNIPKKRVLAVCPTSVGFGFAVFEGPSELLDWAVVSVAGRRPREYLKKIGTVVDRCRVDVVVTEDPERSPHRCARVRKLLKAIHHSSKAMGTRWKGYSRAEIRRTFVGMGIRNKRDIAVVIAERFPELASRVPPPRRPWMLRDTRMAIFDSVAMVATYFATRRSQKGPDEVGSARQTAARGRNKSTTQR